VEGLALRELQQQQVMVVLVVLAAALGFVQQV
jgi:hypothetical protein